MVGKERLLGPFTLLSELQINTGRAVLGQNHLKSQLPSAASPLISALLIISKMRNRTWARNSAVLLESYLNTLGCDFPVQPDDKCDRTGMLTSCIWGSRRHPGQLINADGVPGQQPSMWWSFQWAIPLWSIREQAPFSATLHRNITESMSQALSMPEYVRACVKLGSWIRPGSRATALVCLRDMVARQTNPGCSCSVGGWSLTPAG